MDPLLSSDDKSDAADVVVSSMAGAATCAFEHEWKWQFVYFAMCAITGGRVLWTSVGQPTWWLEFLDFIGLPPVFIAVLQTVFICGIHPLRFRAMAYLWFAPEFREFVKAIKDQSVDGRSFNQQFQKITSAEHITVMSLQWLVGWVAIPLLGLWLAAVPHWYWVYGLWIFPDAIRLHILGQYTTPFHVALSASQFRAEWLISHIESLGSAEGGWDTPSCWTTLCSVHQRFDRDMIALWQVACVPIVVLGLEVGLFAVGLAIMGMATTQTWISFTSFAGCVVACLVFLLELKPMADTTALCQNLGPGCNSIRKAATMYASWTMDTDTAMQYTRFAQYLDKMPTGIEVRMLGQVSYAMLVNKGVLIATALPAVLTFARLHFTASEEEHAQYVQMWCRGAPHSNSTDFR